MPARFCSAYNKMTMALEGNAARASGSQPAPYLTPMRKMDEVRWYHINELNNVIDFKLLRGNPALRENPELMVAHRETVIKAFVERHKKLVAEKFKRKKMNKWSTARMMHVANLSDRQMRHGTYLYRRSSMKSA